VNGWDSNQDRHSISRTDMQADTSTISVIIASKVPIVTIPVTRSRNTLYIRIKCIFKIYACQP